MKEIEENWQHPDQKAKTKMPENKEKNCFDWKETIVRVQYLRLIDMSNFNV